MAVGEAGPWVLDDAEFVFNSVDLSDHVRSVQFPISLDEFDVSAMGDDAWKQFLVGPASVQMVVEFWQDYYTSEVNATLRADAVARTKRAFTLMPDKTAGVSATNEQATGNCYITEYPWLSGNYNEALTTSVTFRVTGTVTFATS